MAGFLSSAGNFQAVLPKLVLAALVLLVKDSVAETGRFNARSLRKSERVEPVRRASSDSWGNSGRFSGCAVRRPATGMRYGRGSGKRVPLLVADIVDPGRTEDGGCLGRIVIEAL